MLHLIMDHLMVNLVRLFPLPWEGYKPHCSHVRDTSMWGLGGPSHIGSTYNQYKSLWQIFSLLFHIVKSVSPILQFSSFLTRSSGYVSVETSTLRNCNGAEETPRGQHRELSSSAEQFANPNKVTWRPERAAFVERAISLLLDDMM